MATDRGNSVQRPTLSEDVGASFEWLYGAMVSYLLRHGWRRADENSGRWWRWGFGEATISGAVEQQMKKDGVDFGKRLIGEPDEFWSEDRDE